MAAFHPGTALRAGMANVGSLFGQAASLDCSLWQIVNCDRDAFGCEFFPHDYFNDTPIAPGQAAANARHVNGSARPSRLRRHALQALAHRFVTHRRR